MIKSQNFNSLETVTQSESQFCVSSYDMIKAVSKTSVKLAVLSSHWQSLAAGPRPPRDNPSWSSLSITALEELRSLTFMRLMQQTAISIIKGKITVLKQQLPSSFMYQKVWPIGAPAWGRVLDPYSFSHYPGRCDRLKLKVKQVHAPFQMKSTPAKTSPTLLPLTHFHTRGVISHELGCRREPRRHFVPACPLFRPRPFPQRRTAGWA